MKTFRRKVRIVCEPGIAHGEIADDFHHFAITLTHDGERVISVAGEGLRTPWNTCLTAPRALAALAGLPLQSFPADFVRQSDSHAQCTHMYELAAVAASHALRDVARVEYSAEVRYPIGEVPVRVTLARDGLLLLDWQVCRRGPEDGAAPERMALGDVIVSPEPFAGRPLAGLLRWARGALSPEMFDAVYIFRRAIGISAARTLDLDAEDVDMAALLFGNKMGDCFTFQPEHRAATRRVRGSTLDFSERPEAMLRPEPG